MKYAGMWGSSTPTLYKFDLQNAEVNQVAGAGLLAALRSVQEADVS